MKKLYSSWFDETLWVARVANAAINIEHRIPYDYALLMGKRTKFTKPKQLTEYLLSFD